jgi:hypothetical protein
VANGRHFYRPRAVIDDVEDSKVAGSPASVRVDELHAEEIAVRAHVPGRFRVGF